MVPATISVIFRNIFDRVGLTSLHQRTGLPSAIRFNRWQRMLAAVGDWSAFLNLAWRSEVLLRDRRERFRRFCRIPRMTALMSLASAGMPRYAAAGIAGEKA
jgi:hypothetical protein